MSSFLGRVIFTMVISLAGGFAVMGMLFAFGPDNLKSELKDTFRKLKTAQSVSPEVIELINENPINGTKSKGKVEAAKPDQVQPKDNSGSAVPSLADSSAAEKSVPQAGMLKVELSESADHDSALSTEEKSILSKSSVQR